MNSVKPQRIYFEPNSVGVASMAAAACLVAMVSSTVAGWLRARFERRNDRRLPRTVENCRLGPIGSDVEGEGAVGCGQPVALLVLAGGLGPRIESERAVRVGLETLALRAQRVAIQSVGVEEVVRVVEGHGPEALDGRKLALGKHGRSSDPGAPCLCCRSPCRCTWSRRVCSRTCSTWRSPCGRGNRCPTSRCSPSSSNRCPRVSRCSATGRGA